MNNTMINVNGTWKQTTPWINIGGTWKQTTPWINSNGTWKQCYSTTSTMTVNIPSTGDSTSQSQSRSISVSSLQSIISCTVNTGTVSYTVNGTLITINVDNGSSVWSDNPTQTCTGTWSDTYTVVNGIVTAGSTPPSTIPYNDGTYSGNLNEVGVDPAYQSNYNAYLTAKGTGGSWSGLIVFDYSAILPTIVPVYYYAYVVTLTYQ